MKVEFYVEDEFLAQSKRLSKKYYDKGEISTISDNFTIIY